MLDESRIERLLMHYRKALEEVLTAAEAYTVATQVVTATRLEIALEMEYTTKFAKEREVELQGAYAASGVLAGMVETERAAEHNLEVAEIKLKVAQEAISLWRALAYQISGGRHGG